MNDDNITGGSGDDTLIISDDTVTLDLGYGAIPPEYSSISYTGGVDTITLDPAWTNMATSITLPSSYTTSIGAVGATGSSYTINTGAGFNGTYASGYSNVNITSAGIDMGSGQDITLGGRSLSEFMTKMEERLAILVPDPKKLEKFEALKKAYENYKLMEKLCQEETKEDE